MIENKIKKLVTKVRFHVYSDFRPHLDFPKILCGEKSKMWALKID